jgi:hypothetical protein
LFGHNSAGGCTGTGVAKCSLSFRIWRLSWEISSGLGV